MPFPDLPDRLAEVRARIDAAVQRGGHGQAVRIIAVTKTHGPDAVTAAYNAGIADVGENRVQEALSKMDAVLVSIRWHLIGHLQRNKVKSLPRFDLLHSLDSARLADAVNDVGLSAARPIGARDARDAFRAAGHADATELSMGMSNDYAIAVEEGATLVRLGTILFGAREVTSA